MNRKLWKAAYDVLRGRAIAIYLPNDETMRRMALHGISQKLADSYSNQDITETKRILDELNRGRWEE